MERYFGEEFQPNDVKKLLDSNKTESTGGNGGHKVRRFPSVEDISRRRSEIAIFLQSFHKAITEDNMAIETAAKHFLVHLYGKSEKLRI